MDTTGFLNRKYGDFQTTSQFVVCKDDELIFQCKILEPELGNNRKNKAIPIGDYDVEKVDSPRFGICFQILDVINRTHVLFHWGSFRKNTTACSLMGSAFKDIDGDGHKDVINSKRTFNKFMKIMPDKWKLVIR